MPDIRELGRLVKAKYPGSYDSLDDAELGRRVKAKYPGAYDQFVDTPTEPLGVLGTDVCFSACGRLWRDGRSARELVENTHAFGLACRLDASHSRVAYT